MLALVHPYTPSSDIQPPHRSASSSSSSAASNIASSSSSTGRQRQRQQSQPQQQQQQHHSQQHPHSSHSSRSSSRQQTQSTASSQCNSSLPTTAPEGNDQSFDIHSYPSGDLLKLLASLLTQIASTNDKLDASPESSIESLSRSIPLANHSPIWRTLTSASRSAISTPSSTLTFHARHIPTISLEAYLLRILKYCPTTNEVFLSLLVYFDRMSKLSAEATGRTFVIDSYNIHRLVIAGVTVASKFFSDVFYTNSRYAKVGGLPLPELNQLELQFLLLNDFRLVISSEEMQRYADQLVIYSHSTNSPLAPLPPLSTLSSSPRASNATNNVTAPMQAMGAIDAYGGQVAGSSVNQRLPVSHFTGYMHPQQGYQSNSYSRTPHAQPHLDTGDDTGTETETETEAGETEGGDTTDDEPTIRGPAHSSAGSDTRSLCESISSSDTGEEGEDDDGDGAFGDDEGDGEMDSPAGDRTPERVARGMDGREGERTPERKFVGRRISPERDHRMSSP